MRKSLDPRICNIALDANALDRDGSARNQLVDRFEKLAADGTLNVILPGGVRDEINNPGTPRAVKDAFLQRIFNLRPGLVAEQQATGRRVLTIPEVNAKPGKHAADASHLFVTHDARILRKRSERQDVDSFYLRPPSAQGDGFSAAVVSSVLTVAAAQA